jgi:hypothetical protein
MSMFELPETPKKTKTKKSSERITKARRFRTLARGYRALRKDKATAYQSAAEALEQVEERSAEKRQT